MTWYSDQDRRPAARCQSASGRTFARLACLVLFHLLAASAAWAQALVVIVNKDNPNTVDRVFVRQVYTATAKVWPDGTPVVVFDQGEESEVRENFYTSVIGKSAASMRALWSQNIFTGKGLPPRVATPDEQMKKVVAGNRNAIGYIRASTLDGSVKALLQ